MMSGDSRHNPMPLASTKRSTVGDTHGFTSEPKAPKASVLRTRSKAAASLDRAKALITGDRAEAYGDALTDFTRTAESMKAMFGWDVKPHHIPMIMILVKMSRLQNDPNHQDGWDDMGGYSGLGAEVTGED